VGARAVGDAHEEQGEVFLAAAVVMSPMSGWDEGGRPRPVSRRPVVTAVDG
jgi:hypothetical protein